MLRLSNAAILEKNKLSSDGVWLVLSEIQLSQDVVIRVVRNNEDITWNKQVWTAFPFELDEIKETMKELPEIPVRISNITRTMQKYLEMCNGGVGAAVILRVIHSKHLDISAAELEEIFTVLSTTTDLNWVTFKLGSETPTMLRFPGRRILKDYCPFPYGSIECAVADKIKEQYPSCNKTLGDCRKRNNSARFGGEPSIPQEGLYASNRY